MVKVLANYGILFYYILLFLADTESLRDHKITQKTAFIANRGGFLFFVYEFVYE